MQNYILPVLSVFLILCTLLVCLKANFFFDISGHPFYKFSGNLMILLLALIAFVFSIHAEIFSSYDKLNNKLQGSYDWFNPVDVSRFPIDQYKINKKQFPDNNIQIDKALSKAYDRKYTIVVDKSPSTEPDNFTKRISSDFMKKLGSELQKSISQNGLNLKNVAMEDLFVLTALKKLSENGASKNSVELLYYFGDNITLSPFGKDVEFNKETLLDNVNRYLKWLSDTAYKSARGKYTNFKKIFDDLHTDVFLGDSVESNLYIVSDFEHETESGSSYSELSNSFYALNGLRLNQIDLIRVKGKGTDILKVNETLDLFYESFCHLHFYEFNEDLMYHNQAPIDVVTSIFGSSSEDSLQQALYLYYLWNDNNVNYDYVGSASFESQVSDKSVFLSLRDKVATSHYNELSGYLLMNGAADKIYPFALNRVKFESAKKVPIKFTTDKRDHRNYYLEIGHAGKTFKVREPIILRQVLPTTSCLYLIYMYVVLYISILCLFWYFFLSAWSMDARRTRLKNTLVGVISGMFILMLIPSGFKIMYNYLDLWSNVFDGYQKAFFLAFTTVAIAFHVFYFRYSRKYVPVNK